MVFCKNVYVGNLSMMKSKRATLKDIAKALNVSTTTVSRALNNKSDISDEMRRRVQQTAELLDYKPNAIARSLKKHSQTLLLGLIIPEVDHYFYSTIIKGINQVPDKDHLFILGESLQDPKNERRIIEKYIEHYVAGVIFIPSRHVESIENIDYLVSSKIPHILIDRVPEGYAGSYVKDESLKGAEKAVEFLISKGRRRIAMLKGPEDCMVSNQRLKAYKNILDRYGLKFENKLVVSSAIARKKDGYEGCKKLFEENKATPDAIFTVTDDLAAGVYEYAFSHNISIPKDISVIGYSNSEISKVLYPKLTSVGQVGHELGSTAAYNLIQMIQNSDHVYQDILPTSLVIRDSA